MVWTIAGFVGTLSSLGLASYLTRKVATEPARAAVYAWGALAAAVSCSILVGTGALVAIALLGFAAIDIPLLAIAVGASLVSTAQSILLSALIGLERHARYAWSGAGSSVVGTVAGLAALALGGGVLGYATAVLIASLCATTFLWATSGLGFSRQALAPGLLRELVDGGRPFLGWIVALRVRGQLDVVLTGLLLQPSVAGWLAAAYRITTVTVFIPTVIVTPLLPALSRTRHAPSAYRSLLRDSLAAVLFLTVPVSASVFALAPAIPGLLGWSEPLQHSVPVMMVLAFQQPLVGIDMVLGVSLIALGLEARWFRVAVAGAIFNPALNLVAIPFAQATTGNGAVGAAVVEVLTEMMFFAGAIYLTPRGLLDPAILGRAARIVGCGLVLTVVASALRPASPEIAFVAGGLAYLVTAIALGVVGPAQVRAIRIALRAG
jgi:O-antigen/teichoic acid export membrane protein